MRRGRDFAGVDTELAMQIELSTAVIAALALLLVVTMWRLGRCQRRAGKSGFTAADGSAVPVAGGAEDKSVVAPRRRTRLAD